MRCEDCGIPHPPTFNDLKRGTKMKVGKVDWQKPDWDSHEGDIGFASADLGISHSTLEAKLRKGELMKLPSSEWKKIQNSDSWKVETLEDVLSSHKARRRAKGKGRKLRELISEFVSGKVNAPVAVYLGKSYYLVNGNTRLGLCKLFDVPPVIWCAPL